MLVWVGVYEFGCGCEWVGLSRYVGVSGCGCKCGCGCGCRTEWICVGRCEVVDEYVGRNVGVGGQEWAPFLSWVRMVYLGWDSEVVSGVCHDLCDVFTSVCFGCFGLVVLRTRKLFVGLFSLWLMVVLCGCGGVAI